MFNLIPTISELELGDCTGSCKGGCTGCMGSCLGGCDPPDPTEKEEQA